MYTENLPPWNDGSYECKDKTLKMFTSDIYSQRCFADGHSGIDINRFFANDDRQTDGRTCMSFDKKTSSEVPSVIDRLNGKEKKSLGHTSRRAEILHIGS